MNTLIDALKELETSGSAHCILIEALECIWVMDGDEIKWNTENNREDLYSGDGDTYGGELPEGYVQTESYVFANVDMCTGTMVTYVFDKSMQLTLEELEDEFD